MNYLTEGWDKFTFRAHSNGLIMTNPRGKSNLQKYEDLKTSLSANKMKYAETANKETATCKKLYERLVKQDAEFKRLELIKDKPNLSETCKTFLADIYTEFVYGRVEDIKGKYIKKGLLLEEDAITQYSRITKNFYIKNTERKFNNYVEGEIDFFDDDYVLDTKVNWSIIQYIRTVAKGFNSIYRWQLQTYMWLWNRKKARLVYVLLNTPQHLIRAEQEKLKFDFVGTPEDYKEACAEIQRLHTYDDIELNQKVKTYELERSDEDIEKLRLRVIECRNYLNNFGKVQDDEEDSESEAA